MLCSFLTNDIICKYISNMWNNLTPYSIAISEQNINFLTPHFEFIKKERIKDDEILEGNYSGKLFDSRRDKQSFKKIRLYKIHSNFDYYNFVVYKWRR